MWIVPNRTPYGTAINIEASVEASFTVRIGTLCKVSVDPAAHDPMLGGMRVEHAGPTLELFSDNLQCSYSGDRGLLFQKGGSFISNTCTQCVLTMYLNTEYMYTPTLQVRASTCASTCISTCA